VKRRSVVLVVHQWFQRKQRRSTVQGVRGSRAVVPCGLCARSYGNKSCRFTFIFISLVPPRHATRRTVAPRHATHRGTTWRCLLHDISRNVLDLAHLVAIEMVVRPWHTHTHTGGRTHTLSSCVALIPPTTWPDGQRIPLARPCDVGTHRYPPTHCPQTRRTLGCPCDLPPARRVDQPVLRRWGPPQ